MTVRSDQVTVADGIVRGARRRARPAERRRHRADPGDLRRGCVHHRRGRPPRGPRLHGGGPRPVLALRARARRRSRRGGAGPVDRAGRPARPRAGGGRLPRHPRPPAVASGGHGTGRGARLLPRRHPGGGLRARRRPRRGRQLLRLRRARHGRPARPGHRPDPAALRRRRPVHPRPISSTRWWRRCPSTRPSSSTWRRAPGTPSTTTRRRCSTTPAAAAHAWELTRTFLASHLPTGGAD